MKKRLLLFLILFIFLLAACAGEAESTAVEVLATANTPPAATIESEASEEMLETEEITNLEPETVPGNGCTLTSSAPEASQEYVEIFGVTEQDWVKGPETAALTIVEYGDFQ